MRSRTELEVFNLMKHSHFSYSDAMTLTTATRERYLKLLLEQHKMEKDELDATMRSIDK